MTAYALSLLQAVRTLVAGAKVRQRLSIAGWLARAREREVLRNLSDAQLKDIGFTRADVEREIRRLRW